MAAERECSIQPHPRQETVWRIHEHPLQVEAKEMETEYSKLDRARVAKRQKMQLDRNRYQLGVEVATVPVQCTKCSGKFTIDQYLFCDGWLCADCRSHDVAFICVQCNACTGGFCVHPGIYFAGWRCAECVHDHVPDRGLDLSFNDYHLKTRQTQC